MCDTVCKDSRIGTARKYVYKIKEHVMAGMGRLHRGDSGDECARVWDVLTGLGDGWDPGVKGEGRADIVMGMEIETF